MTKSFVEDFDCGLRSDFTGLRSADAIGDRKDAAVGIGQERVFVQRASFIEPGPIR